MNTIFGVSSPLKPAFTSPEPISTIIGSLRYSGFPFTLLENTEIINVNHKQFDQLDLLDFFDIFNKNSKIIKRFGK